MSTKHCASLVIPFLLILPLQAQNTGALRFFGSGSDSTPNRDRVNIPLDDNLNGTNASTRADVGAGDFAVEFWLRGSLLANSSTTRLAAGSHAGIAWTTGNVIVDRDIYTMRILVH